MRNMLPTLTGLLFSTLLHAQPVLEEVRVDRLCAAGSYMAYPSPRQQRLTPAPPGMRPYYISHYGRAGSHYLTKPSMYSDPCLTLARADSLGKLTPLGRDVARRLDAIRLDAANRWGELTPLGADQQRQIARRMIERFPEVFESNTIVDARSTTAGRCLLSMEHALLELLRNNPMLNTHHNATHRDMYYMNQQDKALTAMRLQQEAGELYREYASRHTDYRRLMAELFSDSAYVSRQVDADQLGQELMTVAASLHNTELGGRMTLLDLFTPEETCRYWQTANARWYAGWGGCRVNDGAQPFAQRNLLRRLIDDADRYVYGARRYVQLRFGHDTVLLPLLCLLDVNGLGVATDCLDSLERLGWADYRIVPMAANLQIVFYHRGPGDHDVLLKVLLNESEATLPLPTDTPPYYKWSDLRQYCLDKLETYKPET